MLRINELTIGDWLQHSVNDPRHEGQHVSIPVQVRGIFVDKAGQENVIYYDPIDGIEISSPLIHFAPLPISFEMMKGCRAQLVEVGDNGPATQPKYRNRFEKWLVKTVWADCVVWYDRTTTKWTVEGANQVYLDYVHQMQHILRLKNIPWAIDPQSVFAPWIKERAL